MTIDRRSQRSIAACRQGLDDLASRLEKLAGVEALEERLGAVCGAVAHARDAVDYACDLVREVVPPTAAPDRLLEVENWEHPATVLGFVRPRDHELIEVCRVRLQHARGGDHERLIQVLSKLEWAREFSETARRKRLQQGR